MTWASAMSATSARTRSLSVPSISPIMSVARLPRKITPGSSASAPKFTHASTTRSGPTASLSTALLSPFCSETTKPPSVRRPATEAAAAAV